MAPVLIAGLKRACDQQAPETRAIDEQVAFDLAAVLQGNLRDIAALPVERHITYLALDPHHAARLGITPQELRVEPGIEVIGVVVS